MERQTENEGGGLVDWWTQRASAVEQILGLGRVLGWDELECLPWVGKWFGGRRK